MSTNYHFDMDKFQKADTKVFGCFEKIDKEENKSLQASWIDKDLLNHFKTLKISKNFTGAAETHVSFTGLNGETIFAYGLGLKTKCKSEELRKSVANMVKGLELHSIVNPSIDLASFNSLNNKVSSLQIMMESIALTTYKFDKYFSETKKPNSDISVFIDDKKLKKSADKVIETSDNLTNSVNFTRDLVNEAPNVLHSVEYAKIVEKDVKKNLKGVKVVILGKKELQKENMNMFLSVNAGSAHDPKLVHLTYTPKKLTKNTKHIALVGKGVTFDTGGYSLKPGGSMMGMKYDMGGSATVYGAFRAAVLNNSPYKITCILGLTDNAVNEKATTPDSIVKARNGMTVEILNTDAEGRLVLGDCLDYACDQKPDHIIDAATLTGACLVALGSQVCAVLGNDDKFINQIKKSADSQNEYMWQLPIIPEWREDMKSKIADLKNIGTPARAGTATAAAFLENFIKDDISWAHLDIAGVCDSQAHLPYCPTTGASGLIVRSLHELLVNGK